MLYFGTIIIQILLTFIVSFYCLRKNSFIMGAGEDIRVTSGSIRIIAAFVILLVPIIYLTFNVFYLLSYRHSDDLGYLNSFIPPLVFMGRFQPLALQELNVLRYFHLDTVFYQYLLSYLTFFMFLLINWKILVRLTVVFRAIVLALMCSLPFVQEIYSSAIFAEAEALIFVSIGVLAYKYFIDENKYFWGVLSLLFFTLALYYKETNFLFIVGFSISIIMRSVVAERAAVVNFSGFLKLFINSNNIYALINLFNSCIFLIAYWFFVYKQMPENVYMPSSDYKSVLNILFFDSPIIPIYVLLFFLGLHIVSSNRKQIFFNLLAGGSLFLVCVLFILELPHNNYYYYLAYWSSFIAFGIYLAEIDGILNIKTINKVVLFLIFSLFIVLIKFEIAKTYISTIWAKNYQYSNLLLSSTFDFQAPGKKIFFTFEEMPRDYAIYRTGVFTESLKQLFPNAKFKVVSSEGCSPWISNNNAQCEAGDENKYVYDYIATQNIDKPSFINTKYKELNSESKYFLYTEIRPSIRVYERDF